MRRTIYDDVHKEFRESVRTFLEREAVPHADDWEQKGMVDRSFWRKAGAAGFVGFEAPEEYGGIGVSDFRFNAIIDEEVEYLGVVSQNFAQGVAGVGLGNFSEAAQISKSVLKFAA